MRVEQSPLVSLEQKSHTIYCPSRFFPLNSFNKKKRVLTTFRTNNFFMDSNKLSQFHTPCQWHCVPIHHSCCVTCPCLKHNTYLHVPYLHPLLWPARSFLSGVVTFETLWPLLCDIALPLVDTTASLLLANPYNHSPSQKVIGYKNINQKSDMSHPGFCFPVPM